MKKITPQEVENVLTLLDPFLLHGFKNPYPKITETERILMAGLQRYIKRRNTRTNKKKR